MFILSTISNNLEFWSVNLTLIYEKTKLKDFKNIKFPDEISNNWPDDLFWYKCTQDSWIMLRA